MFCSTGYARGDRETPLRFDSQSPSGYRIGVPSSDVTAVVLTVDEPYTQRALASVERQAIPVAEVVVVRGTVPFHRALNEGAARVRTPYFVQVDADMVLDPTCCAELRACVAEGVGVAIGHLRDPLLGRVAGIKLFRTSCFEHERFPDSVSPDTDFGNAIARRGWSTVYALKVPAMAGDRLHVFGEHAPDYTPLYTFRKYALVGARHRYRRAAASLRELVRGLRASRHPAAFYALIGTAYGISLPDRNDLLEPWRRCPDFERLERFLAGGRAEAEPAAEVRGFALLNVRDAWRRGYACGIELYRRQAPGAFVASVNLLADEKGTIAWVALVGLCHGLFVDRLDGAEAERAFASLNQVLPYPHRLRLDPA